MACPWSSSLHLTWTPSHPLLTPLGVDRDPLPFTPVGRTKRDYCARASSCTTLRIKTIYNSSLTASVCNSTEWLASTCSHLAITGLCRNEKKARIQWEKARATMGLSTATKCRRTKSPLRALRRKAATCYRIDRQLRYSCSRTSTKLR